MRYRTLILILSTSLIVSSAWASREVIACKGVGKFKGYSAKLDFEAETTLSTVSENNMILTYKMGKQDSSEARPPVTTAKVSLTVPTSAWKKPYSGTFAFTDFYEVNELNKAGGNFSAHLNSDKPYRSFHGHDKDQRWDMMVYFPDEVIGHAVDKFPGLAAMQADLMDQGYYFIELQCSSQLRK